MIRSVPLQLLLFAACSLPGRALALDPAEVPADAPDDSIMASPGEAAEMAGWAAAVFAGKVQGAQPDDRVTLRLVRQDHNVLRLNQSVMESPICIGKQEFKHGLGTHANSEIIIGVPGGAKTFKAMVGVDDNPTTREGKKGSVQFAVEIGGKELVRTKTLYCGDPPVPLVIELPAGTKQLSLKTDATADGAGWDHADWADAQLLGADGRAWWLDQAHTATPPILPAAGAPFSFVYGGKPSTEFLKDWLRAAESKDLPDRTRHQAAWTDPKTGLRVSAEVVVYKRYAAADWLLRFENTGRQDTPILEDIQGLDVRLNTGPAEQPAVLHHLAGDDCSARSFLPLETPLRAPGKVALAPVGGRSSNGTFPFFNLQHGQRGLFTAIGWTGQWAAWLERDAAGPTRLRAGMERTHLLLHPGESIRGPRILLMSWQGDRLAAHNRFRRLMLFHYVPRDRSAEKRTSPAALSSRPLVVPVFWQGYDRYNAHPTWPTEAGQIRAAELARKTGCDFLWLDAAWFPGNFPNGVGNWTCKPRELPNGLKPVSDACHKLGLRFIVWFEPERVAAGTQIAREHPEFVFGGAGGGLFKLNDPAARRFMTDLLVRRIEEFGMDWYRNDFNIDPLGFWRQNDPPDRQGMTEVRYVEGHYAMWDEMLARRPGLAIDNCASGGRRIDLETIQRSIPLWRSDTACGPGRGDWHQAQAVGMNYYLPLHEICAWTPDAYEMRSTSGAGAIVQFAFLDAGFSLPAAREAVAEVRENQKFFYGDFYPLTGCSTEPDQFLAYQVHRPDLGAGLVLAFRRAKCNVLGLSVGLGGIKPEGRYEVEFVDEQRQKTKKTMSGRVLASDLPLMIPRRGESLLVRYREAGRGPG